MKKNREYRRWTAITYPQDFSDSGASLGPQTILRLQKIVDTKNEGGYPITDVVLACGMGPDTHEYPRQTRSFALMMKEWLVMEGTFSQESIHCSGDDNVWNCIQATMEMLSIIKQLGLSRNVLVVSTGFHIYPRMWVTWRLLCTGVNGWKLAFVPAWDGTYDLLHEALGTVKYFAMASWYRFLGKV
jgi:hypothetical protein